MSARRRGATDLSGILLVDKPAGMTSHDVVSAVRRATGEGRVGHAGTLDPMATGLLVVLVGPATRLEPYLSAADKTYEATIEFGAETDTDDAEGTVTRTAPVPIDLGDLERARSVLATFVGQSMQMPPAYSAIKVGGMAAHRAARAGTPLDLQAREIRVTEAELQSIETGPTRWNVTFTVSKGTYIRSLARDIGAYAESAAHLSALRRTRSGGLDVAEAHSLGEIATAAEAQTLDGLWSDPIAALHLPVLRLDISVIADGRPLALTPPPDTSENDLVAICVDGGLAALYRARQDHLSSEVVFAHPVKGEM